jgi:hypothetical protein
MYIGNTIAVAAINITIIDADNFTRDFYTSKQMPLALAIPIVTPVYPDLDTSVPPHNGFGSYADSIQTCKGSLQPKSIRKDEAKLRKYQGMILRYFCSIKNPKSEDNFRKFIISIYLEDDTISISEPPIRNSGHKGGVFLSRSGLTNNQNRTINPKDLFVGADIHICAIDFCIHDADEYTQRYMSENSHLWECSNIDNVIQKLLLRKDILQRLILLTTPNINAQTMDAENINKLLEKAGIFLNKQEMVTLFRTLDTTKTGTAKLSKILKYLI